MPTNITIYKVDGKKEKYPLSSGEYNYGPFLHVFDEIDATHTSFGQRYLRVSGNRLNITPDGSIILDEPGKRVTLTPSENMPSSEFTSIVIRRLKNQQPKIIT
jgi:hypothetical protein